MKKKVTGLFSAAVASSVVLTGCGNADAESSAGAEVQQVLNLVETADLPTMDPSQATASVSFTVINNVYEGLFRLGENDELVPGVAKRDPDVSEDGLTYTFHLREDARWSNGETVTAHDFVFAWQRMVNPETTAEFAYMMFDIKNAEEINRGELPVDALGVTALDDFTLEVQLENAIPYFQALTITGSFMPLNQEFVESKGSDFALSAEAAIYNGPFILSEWNLGSGWQLQPNEYYWDRDVVTLEEINVHVVDDVATAVNLYETGRADRVFLTSAFVNRYSSEPEFGTKLVPSVFYLRINQEVEELQNRNLRRAIAMSFDKEGVTDVILNDGSIPANGYVPREFVESPSGVDFREENGDILVYDVEQAQAYWEQAQQELEVDNITIELLVNDTDNDRRISEFLQAQIQTNLEGVTIEIRQQPFRQRLDLESRGDFQISLGGWGPDFLDPMAFLQRFVTGNSLNVLQFENPEFDSLIKAAGSELLHDLDTRWDALLQAERVLLEEAAIAPIFQRGRSYIQRENIRNLHTHIIGGELSFKWTYIAED